MTFEAWTDVNLDKGRTGVLDIGSFLFCGDSDAMKIGARLKNNSGDVEVVGDVKGVVIRPDGDTVTFDGDSSGNEAWIVLPSLALLYPGKIEIFLRINDVADSAVAVYATATVKRSSTDVVVVDDGAVIPNISELLDAAETALNAAAAAQEIVTSIAVTGTTLVIP